MTRKAAGRRRHGAAWKIVIGSGLVILLLLGIFVWRSIRHQSPSELELRAVVAATPDDSNAHAQLARHLYREAWFSRDPASVKLEMHHIAYRTFKTALSLCSDEIERCFLLRDFAWAAFHAQDYAEAGRLARAMVTKAASPVAHSWEDCNRGNNLHAGHLILGRVALLRGGLAQAKLELLEAGRTPGSPQLNSFGPNMSLAKELLERGERDVVLEYFTLCGKFWRLTFGKLGRWSRQVNRGEIPDFGANLVCWIQGRSATLERRTSAGV